MEPANYFGLVPLESGDSTNRQGQELAATRPLPSYSTSCVPRGCWLNATRISPALLC